ncbi:transketolase [Kiloniella sp. b19]|uniref:transketolase n=1 Tax=Kiloniella sp. GXU_MW_B19 TaxID=3141326 RepID=UPI0031DC5AC8
MTTKRLPISADDAASGTTHKDMANAIRFLSMDAVQKANSGHPGMPMGMADVATVLYSRFMKFDPLRPDWHDRDRFVLSAGHGSMLIYSLLHLTGYPDMTMDQIRNFRQLGAITAGHPEYGHAPGIETTTGPLGQGIATSVGMALAEKMLAARFGNDLVDHYTYVIAGDGCLMEGISHEAISMAGHLKLNKLIVLWDDNSITIDGSTDVSVSDDQLKRFEASGWDAVAIDGHDPEAIASAIEAARNSDKPSLIACKTVIGFGAPTKAGTAKTHGAPLGDEEIAGARKDLDWPHEPFTIPENVLAAWRAAGTRGAELAAAWDEVLKSKPADQQKLFENQMTGKLPDGWKDAMQAYKKTLIEETPKWATRVASQKALDVLAEAIPYLAGGSADLTGSNNTKAASQTGVTPTDFTGNYIYYGVREHGMAAAMNGLALHGGFIPYGGTFMVFTDYCRPSIRLSALMNQRVVYVMTHDSIGLGEDGPTHQPVEHLAALRCMPNVAVFRPADALETAECWELALENETGPSVLALTRQGLPYQRKDITVNYSGYGAYILNPSVLDRRVTLLASGSEVEIALEAQKVLEADGIGTAVISVPCWELFKQQPQHYRDEVLDPGTLTVACEAASSFGWHEFIGQHGAFVGMTGFGASAPADQLYKHFNITSDAIVDAVKARL